MASKRTIKKEINNLSGELFAECISCLHFNNAKVEDADNVMLNILNMQDDLIRRVSHPEPGMKAKEYFLHLRQNMAETVGDIVNQIEALV